MRTHYGPWQPCWISNQHQKHKSGRGSSSEHFWQVWLKSVQRFQRRRFKCEKLTDAYPWQKLTWHMARWAKKLKSNFILSYKIAELNLFFFPSEINLFHSYNIVFLTPSALVESIIHLKCYIDRYFTSLSLVYSM